MSQPTITRTITRARTHRTSLRVLTLLVAIGPLAFLPSHDGALAQSPAPPRPATQKPAATTPVVAPAAIPGEEQVRLYIVQQSLVSAFETLGVLGNVGVQIDPSIDRVAAGVNLAGTTQQAFAQLARLYGLFYWYDGSRYTIAPANGLPRWIVNAGALDNAVVNQLIGSVAPLIAAEAIRFDPQTRLIHVSGPRELKDALELAIDNAGRDKPSGISVIRFGVTAR